MKKKDLLLIVDMQNAYLPGGKWCCENAQTVAERISDAIRSNAFDQVVFTRFIADRHPNGVWKEYNTINKDVIEDSSANNMMELFTDALDKYPLFTKSVYSALSIPELQSYVDEADRIAVAGVTAECCVLSTVFSLIDLGKYVIWLKDCVAGTDSCRENAVQMVLSDLVRPHICFMTLDEYISGISAGHRNRTARKSQHGLSTTPSSSD